MKVVGSILGALVSCLACGTALAEQPISAYGRLPAMQQVSLSPSGDAYAYDAGVGEKRYVLVRSATDGKVIQSVDTNRFKIRGLQWADNGHLLIVMSGTHDFGGVDKYELPAVMLVDVQRHRLRQLIPSEDDLQGGPLAVATQGGHAYGYFPGRDDVVKRVDLDTNQVVTAVTLPRGTAQVAVAPDGRVLAHIETTDQGRAWRLISGPDGSHVLASGRSEHDRPEILGFGRTPDTILFSKPDDGEFDSAREVSLASGKASDQLVTGGEGKPIHDRKTRLLIGFLTSGRSEDATFLDPAIQARWTAVKAAFPGEQVTLQSFDDAMQQWIVHTEGDKDAGRFFLIDQTQHRAIPLGEDYPEIKSQDVASARWFDYTAADGTALHGVLTLPVGRDPHGLPVVVMPHGGPAGRDTPHFDWWAQAIASRGYAVFQPNFRGSTGYGRHFEQAGWGQWGKLMQTDVSDGLHALVARGVVDAKRACIVGWSYGGYATLAGITVQNGLYRCAAAGGAVADLGGMLSYEYDHAGGERSPTMRYWKASMALKGIGDPAGAAVSPARLASRADAPLLLIHGKDDTVVPFSQAQEMLDNMRRAHKPVELVVLPGEDHWLSSGETRTRMLEAMIGFLKAHDRPDEGTSSTSAQLRPSAPAIQPPAAHAASS